VSSWLVATGLAGEWGGSVECLLFECEVGVEVNLFPHYGVLAAQLGAAGVAPATTMLGVTRLAIPGQMVELEATAVA
jgi:hypothetical protein